MRKKVDVVVRKFMSSCFGGGDCCCWLGSPSAEAAGREDEDLHVMMRPTRPANNPTRADCVKLFCFMSIVTILLFVAVAAIFWMRFSGFCFLLLDLPRFSSKETHQETRQPVRRKAA